MSNKHQLKNNNFPALGSLKVTSMGASAAPKSKKKGKGRKLTLSNLPEAPMVEMIYNLDLTSLLNLVSNANLKSLVVENIKLIFPKILHNSEVLSLTNRHAETGYVLQPMKPDISNEQFLFMSVPGSKSSKMNLFTNNIPHPFTVYRLHLIGSHLRALTNIQIYNLFIALRTLEVNYLSTLPFTESEFISIFKDINNLEKIIPLLDGVYRIWGKNTFGFQLYYIRLLVLHIISLTEDALKQAENLITKNINYIIPPELFANDKWHRERMFDRIIGSRPMELCDFRHLNVAEDKYEFHPQDIFNKPFNKKRRDIHISDINRMITKQIECIVLKKEAYASYNEIIQATIAKFDELFGINQDFVDKLFSLAL